MSLLCKNLKSFWDAGVDLKSGHFRGCFFCKKTLDKYICFVLYYRYLKRGNFFCVFNEGGLYIPKYREVPLMRVKITLACTECKQRNYNTMKNKKNDPDRLEMNKYCRFCKKHTLHKETK